MTGIERLREYAVGCRIIGQITYSNAIGDIADQIERELSVERDRWESDLYEAQVEWNRVTGVCLEMERHCLYNEDTTVRDAARWARELRHAMKSDASDERDAQNPSCTDAAEAADVTSEAAKVTLDPAEDVSMSAYDLLPEEEREAIAWVREHGGLESVMSTWENDVVLVKSVIDELWNGDRPVECGNDDVMDELRRRLVPEGMEWMLWDDGKPVTYDDAPDDVIGVYLALDGSGYALMTDLPDKLMSETGERVKRPEPKVLDADGVEIRVGDRVWSTTGEFDGKRTVSSVYIDPGEPPYAMFEERQKPYSCLCFYLTHRAPVLAADGKPLEVGQTVWDENGDELVIGALEDGGHTVTCRYVDVGDAIPVHGIWSPSDLTHERPDSWERLEKDACKGVCDYFNAYKCDECEHVEGGCCKNMARDLVRRCRALAERERGE